MARSLLSADRPMRKNAVVGQSTSATACHRPTQFCDNSLRSIVDLVCGGFSLRSSISSLFSSPAFSAPPFGRLDLAAAHQRQHQVACQRSAAVPTYNSRTTCSPTPRTDGRFDSKFNSISNLNTRFDSIRTQTADSQVPSRHASQTLESASGNSRSGRCR